jgi:hypothetical protein
MKYILDGSVGIKWVMNEADSAVARRLRDAFQNQVHGLIAPDSFPLGVVFRRVEQTPDRGNLSESAKTPPAPRWKARSSSIKIYPSDHGVLADLRWSG